MRTSRSGQRTLWRIGLLSVLILVPLACGQGDESSSVKAESQSAGDDARTADAEPSPHPCEDTGGATVRNPVRSLRDVAQRADQIVVARVEGRSETLSYDAPEGEADDVVLVAELRIDSVLGAGRREGRIANGELVPIGIALGHRTPDGSTVIASGKQTSSEFEIGNLVVLGLTWSGKEFGLGAGGFAVEDGRVRPMGRVECVTSEPVTIDDETTGLTVDELLSRITELREG